ncbi:hypothetical protein CR513_52434, partial [Mucuna pruriens]
MDAAIPVEIGEPSPRALFFQLAQNEEEIRANLDLLQEVREVAHIKEVTTKTSSPTIQYKGDLVLRRVLKDNTSNKLTPNWEGPYKIIEEVGKGTFWLEHLEGKKVPLTYNMTSLRMMFSQAKCKKPKRPEIGSQPMIPQAPKDLREAIYQ